MSSEGGDAVLRGNLSFPRCCNSVDLEVEKQHECQEREAEVGGGEDPEKAPGTPLPHNRDLPLLPSTKIQGCLG